MAAKTATYFPVKTNNYSTTKSSEIRMEHGFAGYGIYFTLLQLLASTPSRTLELKKIKATAYNIRCDEQKLSTIIHNYFEIDGGIFYSKELNDSLGWFDDKYNRQSAGGKKTQSQLTPEQRSEKAKKASAARWDKRPKVNGDANSCQVVSNSIPTTLATDANNKKEEEIKENRNQNEVNQHKEGNTSDTHKTLNSTYDVHAIQEEIRNHTSKYFDAENIAYVTHVYNEFRKEIPTSINLSKFEPLIYLHYIGIWLSEMPANPNGSHVYPENVDMNSFLAKNHYKISPTDLKTLVNSVNTKSEIKKIYQEIVQSSKFQLQKMFISTNGKLYTQEQLDNYEDIPI